MKILLTAINAKYIHSNLAVYSLKAYAKKYKHNIEIAEFTINQNIDAILQQIYKAKPDIIAFSCYIWNIEYIKALCEDLHKVLPNTDLWVGGPEVSYDATEFLENNHSIKGVMIGEGEEIFYNVCKHYIEQVIELKDIKGLVFKDDNKESIITPPQPPISMDNIPFVYNDLTVFDNRIIYYESSRGCPYSCSYCLSSIDKYVRFRSVELVKKELQFFLDNNVKQVKFVDRTFNCNHKRTYEIVNFIKENDNGITNFHFEIAADIINEDEISLFNSLRPGLIQLEIGVQSTNNKTIKEIDRVMDFSRLSTVVNKINSANNIHQHLDLIAGLPYENYDSFVKSFNDVYLLNPNQLQLGFLKVLKGSKMHINSKKYNIIYKTKPQYEVLSTNWLDYDEISELKQIEEMVEVYYNTNQFCNTIKFLSNAFNSPFEMYKLLAKYYNDNKLNNINHSRLDRFSHLRNFANKYDNKNSLLYDDLLTFDLYLRDKGKTRPKWCKDLSPYKNNIHNFYKSEDSNRLFLKGYENDSYRQLVNTTHLEVFNYNVLGDLSKCDTAILFDYKNRNKINSNAQIFKINL